MGQDNQPDHKPAEAANAGGRRRSPFRVIGEGMMAVGPDRGRLALGSALGFLTGFLETVLLYLIARVAVTLTNGDTRVTVGMGPIPDTRLPVGTVVTVAAVVLVVLALVSVPLSRVLASLSARVIVRIRTELIQAYLNSSWPYRAQHREGYIAELVGDYGQRAEGAVNQLSTVVVAACALSMVCLGAVATNPMAAAGAVVGLGLTGLLLHPLASRVKHKSLQNSMLNREVVARVTQSARLSEEITAFQVGDAVADELSLDVVKASGALRRLRMTTRLVPNLYQYGALGVVLALIGTLALVAPDGLGQLAPLILLMLRALTYLRQLLTATQAGNELAPYVEGIHTELDVLRANTDTGSGVAIDRFDRLALEAICFEYVPGQPVLRNVNLTVERGEVLGVVGPSGSGKTTLTQLILRLRQPTSGRLLAGSVDLATIAPLSWSRVVSFVPQDNKLIFATVADNIRFFRTEFDLDEIEVAAKAAHVHDEIVGMPQGYATLVGPGARNLSGGQRQRVGLARALLGTPQLLVLDEPTSALDQKSETLIRQTLHEIKGSTTVVLVAHRPATLQVCDRLVMVEHGEVTAVRSVAPVPT
jgi:ATP-binding cassette, subfamily B, bacterial